MRKIILSGQKIPKFYGIAYRPININGTVCYPIPLNFIISKLRKVYLYFKKGCYKKSLIEQAMQQNRAINEVMRQQKQLQQLEEEANYPSLPIANNLNQAMEYLRSTSYRDLSSTAHDLEIDNSQNKLNAKKLNKINEDEKMDERRSKIFKKVLS